MFTLHNSTLMALLEVVVLNLYNTLNILRLFFLKGYLFGLLIRLSIISLPIPTFYRSLLLYYIYLKIY
ncbi:hypothetical protein ABH960_004126 [Bacillus sp. RC252]